MVINTTGEIRTNFQLESGKWLGLPLEKGRINLDKVKNTINYSFIEANARISPSLKAVTNKRIMDAYVLGQFNFYLPTLFLLLSPQEFGTLTGKWMKRLTYMSVQFGPSIMTQEVRKIFNWTKDHINTIATILKKYVLTYSRVNL
jgi:hypothetical protein